MVEPSVVVLAHPLTQRAELPVSPLVMALGAVYLLFMASALAQWRMRVRADDPAPTPSDRTEPPHNDDPAPASTWARIAFWAARAVGLGLFLFAIVAGRWGAPEQLANITPSLTIGAGWPVLTLAAIVLGGVWWWLNPYDTIARAVSPLGAGDGSGRDADGTWAPVWWATVPAAAWMMYLTVVPSALDPRSIAWALIGYALVTLAGCLAVGRRTWLWRGEFFTVFFGLLAAVRTNGTRWRPPAGAPALLGIVTGGALYGLVANSDLGTAVVYGPRATVLSRVVVLAFMVVTGFFAERAARRSAPGSIAIGLAPLAAAAVVALGIGRNRLTTSLQLLPITASNPLGGDLDLFGTRSNALRAQPFGEVGPVWIQAGILLAGAVVGVLLARRCATLAHGDGRSAGPTPRRSAGVAFVVLGTVLGVGVAAAAAI